MVDGMIAKASQRGMRATSCFHAAADRCQLQLAPNYFFQADSDTLQILDLTQQTI
jgi:hypothetical protein